MNSDPSLCPCGSGNPLAECCGPYLSGDANAPTAEALMRSRYSAYVLLDEPYLLNSWHSTTRPKALGLKEDERVEWLGLTVEGGEAGRAEADQGVVTFTARFRVGDKMEQIREASRFLKEEGVWRYLDGKMLPPAALPKVGRNDPCPCGSGKKSKKCCGA